MIGRRRRRPDHQGKDLKVGVSELVTGEAAGSAT